MCCSYDKRDGCMKCISAMNYLSLLGLFGLASTCFIISLLYDGQECRCATIGEYDRYYYSEFTTDNPYSLSPATNSTNSDYWIPQCARTTTNTMLWFGVLAPLIFFAACLCCFSRNCNKIKSIDMIGRVKPRMVKAEF